MKQKTSRKTGSGLLTALLLIYLSFTVVYPLLRLFADIRGTHIRDIVTSDQFLPMLGHSLVTTVISTAISVILAFTVSMILHRSRVKGKSVFAVLFTIPMLIPSISHGMGLVLLLGDNGILTNLLHMDIGFYGYKGIILGSVLYSFPVAFLLFYDAFRYEDYTTYEVSRVLGLSKTRQFLKITLPGMKQAWVSSSLAVFTMVFTDYGVPLITGGTVMTLPVYMYREVIGMMNFSGGAVVGVILLLPAVVAFLFDMQKSRKTAPSGSVMRPYKIEENRVRDGFAYAALIFVLFLLCLPVLSFVWLSFVKQYPIDLTWTLDHIRTLFEGGIGLTTLNSVAVALSTALFGTIIAYMAAFVTTRSRRTVSTKCLHFISLLPLAVPGVVLGLAFIVSFHRLPVYGTIFILIMVNVVHFFSSPYLLAYNSLSKFHPHLDDVARTLHIGPMRMLTAVYLPSTLPTVVEMYSYFFVNAMITISAVSFLVNFRTTTLSLLIPQLEAQSFLEGTAIVSLLILLLNLAEKGMAFFVKRSMTRQESAGDDLSGQF